MWNNRAVADETTRGAAASRGGLRRRGTRRAELIKDLATIYLAEGFAEFTVDELCDRLHCSKTTLYTIASSKEQIVQAVTRHFFATATQEIEDTARGEADLRLKINSYLRGIGSAMSRSSAIFYQDMLAYEPTAHIYRLNSEAAAERVRGMIEAGVRSGQFRSANATFAAQVVTMAIDGILSGQLLDSTGMTAGQAYAELGDLVIDGLARTGDGATGTHRIEDPMEMPPSTSSTTPVT